MLELKNLKKSYREPNGNILPVLDIPEFRVEAGEQMVLIGDSGCGKSTLLNVIAGISQVDSGSVVLDGRDISRLSESGRDRYRAAKLGYVFQTFNLLTGFSARENVMLGMTFSGKRADSRRAAKPWKVLMRRMLGGASPRREDSRRAAELLREVGLEGRMNHRPSRMSVGEQQRVAVARALANSPRLLLADEPTANVDPANQQKILDLIRSACRRENIAMIMVTHSMEAAKQFSRVERLQDINQAVSKSA